MVYVVRMKSFTDLLQNESLWRALGGSSQRTLLLDYDGTLAPFVPDRTKAVPYPGVRERLARIQQAGTRLVFITGRNAAELLPFLDLPEQPEIWGSHGGERLLPNGWKEPLPLSEDQTAGLARAKAWMLEGGYAERLEEKPGCLALHLRGMEPEEAERLAAAAETVLGGVAQHGDLALHRFDGGLELRVPGMDKGRAVRQILLEMDGLCETCGPNVATCEHLPMPFYLGDDVTDEDAFTALNGNGVSVLVRREPRESAAEYRILPPEELVAFLDRWLELPRVSPG